MDNGLEERLVEAEEEEVDQSGDPRLRRRIWNEFKMIWRITFPSIVARMTSFGIILATQSFLGHVSEIDLATFALVQSIFLRFVNGILVSSCNKLLSFNFKFKIFLVVRVHAPFSMYLNF